jgi:hypothetical protein
MFGELLNLLDRWRSGRAKARLRIHRASLLIQERTPGGVVVSAPAGVDCYFLNIRNLSRQREVEVMAVWLATDPPVPALVKPLSAVIAPGGQSETWIEVARVPRDARKVDRLGRATLGHRDRPIKSRRRRRVPPGGHVPGQGCAAWPVAPPCSASNAASRAMPAAAPVSSVP